MGDGGPSRLRLSRVTSGDCALILPPPLKCLRPPGSIRGQAVEDGNPPFSEPLRAREGMGFSLCPEPQIERLANPSCQRLPKPAASPSCLSDGYRASAEMRSAHIPIMTLSVSQLSARDSQNVTAGIRK